MKQRKQTVGSETKASRFRAWKSGKIWLYSATILVTFLGGLQGVAQPFYSQGSLRVHAATQSSTATQLAQGNSSYATTDPNTWNLTTPATWTNSGTAAALSNGWSTLNPNTKNAAGYLVLNQAIDMSKSFTLGGLTLKTDATDGGTFSDGPSQVGDPLGIILTPVSTSDLTDGQTGGYLGIGGLPNTIFVGRDLYANSKGSDQNVGDNNYGTTTDSNYSSDLIAIRTTTSTGVFVSSTSTLTGTQMGISGTTYLPTSVSAKMPDANTPALYPLSAVGRNSSGDTVSLSWNVISVDTSAGTVTGTLSYTENGAAVNYLALSLGGSYPATATISQILTVPNNLSLGFIGGTGGYASNLSVAVNNGSLNATKAATPVTVNYISALTGKAIAAPSGITSTIGDTLTPTTSGILNYVAPDGSSVGSFSVPSAITDPTNFTNYTFDYAAPVGSNATTNTNLIVSNYASGTTDSNAINVYYTPGQASASFSFYYIEGTPGTTNTAIVTNDQSNDPDTFLNSGTSLSGAVATTDAASGSTPGICEQSSLT